MEYRLGLIQSLDDAQSTLAAISGADQLIMCAPNAMGGPGCGNRILGRASDRGVVMADVAVRVTC